MPVLLLMSMCLFASIVLTSFKAETLRTDQVAVTVRQSLVEEMAALKQQSQLLAETLELLSQEQVSPEQAQEAFYRVKQAYKRVEFMAEYLDPELAKKINGAPLPKVLVEEANYQTLHFQKPSVRTFPPEGLQVLEELLFAEEVEPGMAKKAVVLAHGLQDAVSLMAGSLYQQPLSDKQVLESLREQLVRVMAMGITGFDAPAAGREIAHAAVALQPVLIAAQQYERATGGKARTYSSKAAQHLQQAVLYLQQHPTFGTFDRLYFTRELADPAYAALTALQQELLPTAASVHKPVNDHASSLFSADYLQAAYFAKQDRKEQKPELVELGKVLFFDPVLSANNERSCASCHVPSKAFTDGQARSIAFDFKGTVQRNSPTLLNSVFSNAYFWDSRAVYLQDQVPDVVVKSDELHGNYEEVVQKLQQSPEYRKLFKRAFSSPADNGLNTNTINRAIAAYVQSLVALNSPFDQYMRRETEQLGASAKRGYNLFMGKAACGTCHFAPTFNGTVPPRYLESETEVLGVTASADFAHPQLDEDLGRAGIIPADAWKHSFKTPTVRNAALTAPYMHNGAFTSLAEVVDFYDAGGGAGLGLDVPNQTLPDSPLKLTTQEKQDLIAFMESLTDTATVFEVPKRLPRFSKNTGLNGRPVGGRY
ncbi:cytochrome-c peroxidase [Pontibacter toksunensis]|uniref:Cytochrome-c peroxidase n=1 Tax=Pontibacter toksunensis TaxID=1332631 RepID=A0ABW6BZM5_9BACT